VLPGLEASGIPPMLMGILEIEGDLTFLAYLFFLPFTIFGTSLHFMVSALLMLEFLLCFKAGPQFHRREVALNLLF